MDLLEEARKVLADQTAKGIRTYGQTLDVTKKTAPELLDEAIEEAADQLMYLLAARRALRPQHICGLSGYPFDGSCPACIF